MNTKIKNFCFFNFKKIESKKAASHVEVIISFAIFIGFLVFMYAVLEPAVRSPIEKEYSLASLKTNFLNHISSKVERYEFSVEESTEGDYPSGCLKIKTYDIKNNITIKDEMGDIVQSNFKINQIGPEEIIMSSPPEIGEKYSIYSSEDFEEGSGSCYEEIVDCSAGSIGSDEYCYYLNYRDSEEHILRSKIEMLKEDYEGGTTEEMLRSMLDIPARNWFWFNFSNDNREQLIVPAMPEIPEEVNVYSEEIPITYIDDDPETELNGFLVIKTW